MKTVEFEQVYIEIPEELVLAEENTTTISFSIEELKKRLEETQSLHL